MALKVGDMVVVTSSWFGKGRVGRIESISTNRNFPITIDFGDEKEVYSEDELEKQVDILAVMKRTIYGI